MLSALCAAPATGQGPARNIGGNRLSSLDRNDPYYPSLATGRLVTPQWVGEEGVDAVVLLSIDDMNDIGRYEAWLRPVLECLKEDGGRAPLSILTNSVDPTHQHLQKWLDEGVTIEVHTVDHPCPLLNQGGLAGARSTYERCVDMVGSIPGNRPVGFRMPCCDSINSVSPRFFSEIFSRKTAAGRFLTMDSSVFNVFTADDPALPLELVEDGAGRPRFSKYLPRDRSFVNTIENYPYPYVIGQLAWELPCVVPSDWEAQHLHGPNKSETVIDLLAAINATVIKQGLFTFVFHPHGWIRNDQVINIIRQTRAQFGDRVRFLSMRDVQERLDNNLLLGEPLRRPDGSDNGVRIIDVDGDGYQDVVIGNERVRRTRRWSPHTRRFEESEFPIALDAGARFGVVDATGRAALIVNNESAKGAWRFDGGRWVEVAGMLKGLKVAGQPVLTSEGGRDRGVRLRDLDGDGICEVVVGNPEQTAVFGWSPARGEWKQRPYTLPEHALIVDAKGHDAGLRFVDVNEDGRLDLLFSDAARWSLHLFTSPERGWSQEVTAGTDGAQRGLPPFVRDGTDSGAWFHSGHLWTQNEGTAAMANHVDRRAFSQLLASRDPPERTTEQAARALHARPGLRVELVAAEPLIKDPIAFDWGPDGRLWVVEMGDYPLGDPGATDGGGLVRFLRDEDVDGRYDTSTVFKDGLSFPTGVMAWRDGVLICCPPHVLYAEDRDGDGRADHEVILFEGFGTGNQQHRANGFRWGLDNHVYGANGDSGGDIRSIATGAVVDISGRDFRLLPDTGVLDPQSGQTQFGRSRDDWGNWFGGNNSNPLWHFVLGDHYLRRNPHVAAHTARVAVPEQAGKSRVYPRMPVPERFNTPSDASRLTSACSFAVYRDTLLGPAFSGDLFFCEPSHGLVHRQTPTPSGVTFTSRRAPGEEDTEFLASSDPWFRPTMVRTGPDGALWVADMARFVIEHPEWIPDEWEKRLDLRAGKDRGRIYRVLPLRGRPREVPRFDRLDMAGLVDVLESPNGVQRDIAHRMLVHRRDLSVVPKLVRMTREAALPTARLHALCVLDGLGALNAEHVRAALDDAHPGVRRHAVRLCEGRLDDAPQLVEALLARVNDDAPEVRLQLACTLGSCDDPRAAHALARMAWRDHGDPFLRTAILSSLGKHTRATVMDGLGHIADGADIPLVL
ncbi:MAG: PVC-type heme-binding CxxCH protein, partial [Planctomycetota bacterium]|nr:PVC-type heme-binding CxxCH protein [Planctomycetota bacterium]